MAFLMCSWICFASILLKKNCLLLNASRKLWLSFLLCLYVPYDHCYKYSFKKFKSQNFWEVWITGFHWHLDPVIWALPLLILLQTVCKAYFVKKSLGVIYRLWNYHYGFTTGNKFCNIYHVVWHGKEFYLFQWTNWLNYNFIPVQWTFQKIGFMSVLAQIPLYQGRCITYKYFLSID